MTIPDSAATHSETVEPGEDKRGKVFNLMGIDLVLPLCNLLRLAPIGRGSVAGADAGCCRAPAAYRHQCHPHAPPRTTQHFHLKCHDTWHPRRTPWRRRPVVDGARKLAHGRHRHVVAGFAHGFAAYPVHRDSGGDSTPDRCTMAAELEY